MCLMRIEGRVAVMDCAADYIEFCSPECVNSHFKELSIRAETKNIKTARYEEELVFRLDEEKTALILEYIDLARDVESLMVNPETFGHPQDDAYPLRKKALQKIYEALFQNPLLAAQAIQEWSEPLPTRAVFMDGYKRFKNTLAGILQRLQRTRMYALVKEKGDMREAFVSLIGLKKAAFVNMLALEIPPDAKPIADPEASYELDYGIKVRIYELEKSEANLYVQENPILENLPEELKKMLRDTIAANLGTKTIEEAVDYTAMYDTKLHEFRQYFLNQCALKKIPITPEQSLAMAREAVAWVVGLGAPIENMALDRANITDIYIDSENTPMYIEHAKFGLCHTLWRYSRDLMDYMIRNIMAQAKGRKFDRNNPIVDVFLPRLNMRVHLQGPPATFGERQAALRMTKETPFTYAQYLANYSMSAFAAGYDDVMVSLGCSEAVLGLKGVGKTAFTAAKMLAIGTRRRILPIQDIEEIPTIAYRKRGFHIGTMRVMASEKEEEERGSELSLVTMAGASLRMGDAALIINEVRSRLAIQGIINLLNTQPGVFCLYNLHAQSLEDIRSRLELVFGVPGAAMFATDRYSFLKKIRFGRKGRIFRVLGASFESDPQHKEFTEVFRFERGQDIKSSRVACLFLRNPEAHAWDLSGVSVADLAKRLELVFIPPALERRAAEVGIDPRQFILQAFFKGKMYSQIVATARETGNKAFMEMDFVLKCSSHANKLLKDMEKANGEIDYAELEPVWDKMYKQLIEEFLREQAALRAEAGFAAPPAPPTPVQTPPPSQIKL